MRMRRLSASLLTCAAMFSVVGIGVASSACELIVHLDRSLADAGSDEDVFQVGVCPICSGGEDGGADAELDSDSGDVHDAGYADAVSVPDAH